MTNGNPAHPLQRHTREDTVKEKAYTFWLQWADGKWEPTITASGRSFQITARQLLLKMRDDFHSKCTGWKGHTRILPVGQKPK